MASDHPVLRACGQIGPIGWSPLRLRAVRTLPPTTTSFASSGLVHFRNMSLAAGLITERVNLWDCWAGNGLPSRRNRNARRLRFFHRSRGQQLASVTDEFFGHARRIVLVKAKIHIVAATGKIAPMNAWLNGALPLPPPLSHGARYGSGMSTIPPPSVLPRSSSQAVQHLPGSFEVGQRSLDGGTVARDRMPAGEVEKDEVRPGEAVVNLGDAFGGGHADGMTEAPVSVEVPSCFVDPMPLRGPWRQPSVGPPFEAVQLLFADSRTSHGTWCPVAGGASVWWGWCDVERKFTALRPIGWRALEPSHSG